MQCYRSTGLNESWSAREDNFCARNVIGVNPAAKQHVVCIELGFSRASFRLLY